jgi:hypothetical protein
MRRILELDPEEYGVIKRNSAASCLALCAARWRPPSGHDLPKLDQRWQ